MTEERTPRGPTLRIVAFNDVYSLENLPRLKTLVDHYRDADPADAFMVTLAGDFLAPSILSSLDAGRGMVDCLNAIGVTHVIFGNHEDDVAIADLRRRVGELHAMWIDTNVRTFEPPLPASCVVDVTHAGGRSVRVGIVGVVMNDPTVYRGKPFGGADVTPANDAALQEAARLIANGCACVIPMTHQSMDDDRALARATISPRFPVILGGHEHVPFTEEILGTWIVKAGMDAINAVVLDLAWPDAEPKDAPDTPSVTVKLEPVRAYGEDADVRARVNAHMTRVRELDKATLLTLVPGEVLTSIGTRVRQTSMGTLICSRIRDTLGADGALFNGGGIRGAHEYHHHVTYGDLEAEVPFDNEIVVARLPGRVIVDAVRASRAHAPAESGGFLQVDDQMVVDESGIVVRVLGEALDPAREYRIGLIRNLFDGMDHVEPLVAFAKENPNKIPPHGSGREVKIILTSSFALALWRSLGGFDAVDANHDGFVTREELKAAIARVTHEAPSSITADLLLHALDKDHDDAVTRAEADAAAPAPPRGGSSDPT